MVGFDDGTDTDRVLDRQRTARINANLRATADTTIAKRIEGNIGACYMADTKGGAFDIPDTAAVHMLQSPNPHRRPNSDVIFPWTNGLDVTRRSRNMWIIDFGTGTPLSEASRYEQPFQHVDTNVRPLREKNKRKAYRERWWIHVEPRPAMREALRKVNRFLATISVGKHRLFVWMRRPTLPDHQLFAFSLSDDYFFGVLHSRLHEVWARNQGTQVRERESGFRYTPTTCFETFSFPQPTGEQKAPIAEAARELDNLRNNWTNPPEWTQEEVLKFPGSVDGPWARYVHKPNSQGIGTVRYPRIVPKDEECAKQLKRRTLTNLYNERPTWLDLAHKKLDDAVFAAYGWDPGMSDEALPEKLLALNLERAGA